MKYCLMSNMLTYKLIYQKLSLIQLQMGLKYLRNQKNNLKSLMEKCCSYENIKYKARYYIINTFIEQLTKVGGGKTNALTKKKYF